MLDRTAAHAGLRSGPRTPYGPPGAVERLAAALPGPLRDALPREVRSGSPWPVRVDTILDDGVTEDEVESWVPAASVLHSGGNALELAVRDGRVVGLRGRAGDRVNHGRLDPREWQSWRYGPQRRAGRLTRPLVREHGRLVETTWDVAMARIVDRSRKLLAVPGGWGRIAFYTGGRLFLEELYTLAVIGKAGIGTPHMDGDTRLSTAAAAAALMESFGTDGPPGSYGDIDHCDAIALWGHDLWGHDDAQSVLWERMLDRRLGPSPPAMIVVGPEGSPPAREADVHLAVRPGTNLALMNGLLHELIANDWYDATYVADHTIGFDELCRVVDAYPVKRAAEICGVPEGLIEQAAEILGAAERLVSAVEPGFHLAWQATAAVCQVNNLHLLRGMLGRPGAGVLHVGGPPSARNALETGATGGLPGLRNWANPRHVRELAALWNVDPFVIPHSGPPTHAMRIFRYAEEGSIGLLWISAADPARSLPGVDRILRREDVFVVVQELLFTETARLADVVLPAAGWGEKLGTVTGADRTVHLCEKAVEPPGEARPDLDIFLDYARRMDFRDRDHEPLIAWHDPESAFEAWQACSKGRPCDYTGITYRRLRAGGVQWPCSPASSHGTERLYAGGRFNTDPEVCQTFGHDLVTGAEYGVARYLAAEPHRTAGRGVAPRRAGSQRDRAFLRAAEYEPPPAATVVVDREGETGGHLNGCLNGHRDAGAEPIACAAVEGVADLVVVGWDPVARQPLLAPAKARPSPKPNATGDRRPAAPALGQLARQAGVPMEPGGVPAVTGGAPAGSERFEEV